MTHIAEKSSAQRRRVFRTIAAVAAALTSIAYFLIGFHVVTVLDGGADQSWGLAAGAAYALGALLLLIVDRHLVWILGVLLQVFVIYTYFNLSTQRTPAYEPWGIAIRVVQAVLLVVLVYLVVRQPLSPYNGSAQS